MSSLNDSITKITFKSDPGCFHIEYRKSSIAYQKLKYYTLTTILLDMALTSTD